MTHSLPTYLEQQAYQYKLQKARSQSKPPYGWTPHAGKQQAFFDSTADEVLFGGEAGPGKSECLVHKAVGYPSFDAVHDPLFTAVIFRRDFSKLEGASGLIQRSLMWYPKLGGSYNSQKHYWVFPSGARVYFGHMQYETDKLIYQGWEIVYLLWDELTEFMETQYLYLQSRNRAPAGCRIKPRTFAASNPGNVGHKWVKNRFITRDIVMQPRHFAQIDEEDREVDAGHPDALSRVFIPASLADNPSADPRYPAKIKAMGDPVLIAQLLEGDWDAERKEGRVYDVWSHENISSEADYQPGVPVIWMADDGYAYGQGPGTASYHPRVILLAQETSIGGLNIFAEYVETGVSDYNQTIDDVLAMGYPAPDVVYVDSSAAMFRGALLNKVMMVIKSTHAVAEGIRNVRRLVCDQDGVRLLKVHPRCAYTVYEFGEYVNDPNLKARTGELVPLKVNDHAMDALRYGAWHLRFEM